jgi:hypothetical protein
LEGNFSANVQNYYDVEWKIKSFISTVDWKIDGAVRAMFVAFNNPWRI